MFSLLLLTPSWLSGDGVFSLLLLTPSWLSGDGVFSLLHLLLLGAAIMSYCSHSSQLYITIVKLDSSSITGNTITHFVGFWCCNVTDPRLSLAL